MIANGTMETCIGTNGTICIAVCSNNFVTSHEVCPIAPWADLLALREMTAKAVAQHKIELSFSNT